MSEIRPTLVTVKYAGNTKLESMWFILGTNILANVGMPSRMSMFLAVLCSNSLKDSLWVVTILFAW